MAFQSEVGRLIAILCRLRGLSGGFNLNQSDNDGLQMSSGYLKQRVAGLLLLSNKLSLNSHTETDFDWSARSGKKRTV